MGRTLSTKLQASGMRIRYAETQPIPTYLFAFAAGKFQVETAERNGRWYRMFHRETDAKKVARNKARHSIFMRLLWTGWKSTLAFPTVSASSILF